MGENNFFLFLDDYYICFLIRKRYKFMIYTNYYNSPIGRITMASEGTALIGLWFEGQKYFANKFGIVKTNSIEGFEINLNNVENIATFKRLMDEYIIPTLKSDPNFANNLFIKLLT